MCQTANFVLSMSSRATRWCGFELSSPGDNEASDFPTPFFQNNAKIASEQIWFPSQDDRHIFSANRIIWFSSLEQVSSVTDAYADYRFRASNCQGWISVPHRHRTVLCKKMAKIWQILLLFIPKKKLFPVSCNPIGGDYFRLNILLMS